ncbi:ester cyclase [Chloroflexota bacterium]
MRFTTQLHNWEPNSKRIKFETQELIQFKDGKVVEVWAIYHDLVLLRQIGVIPTN